MLVCVDAYALHSLPSMPRRSLFLLVGWESSFHFRRVGMTSNQEEFRNRRRWSQMYIKASTICDKEVVAEKKATKML